MKVIRFKYDDKNLNYKLSEEYAGAWIDSGDRSHHNADMQSCHLCLPTLGDDYKILCTMLVGSWHVWFRGNLVTLEGFVGLESGDGVIDQNRATFNKERWDFIIKESEH